jgi:hypothetical protein
MAACSICNEPITPWHRVVRVVAELAFRAGGDDHSDPATWSAIEDWDTATMMHAECVERALAQGFGVPYASAVSRLLLDPAVDDVGSRLRVIDGEGG